jgi:pSer/pThr/pTyr-binding forkhead associated (FHA) protein
VSREHARFAREHDGVYIEDQASKWGTFVNGEQVIRRKLAPNDRLEFGALGTELFVLFNPDRPVPSTGEK